MKKFRFIFALLIAFSLAAAACGSTDSTPDDDDETTDTTDSSDVTTDDTEVDDPETTEAEPEAMPADKAMPGEGVDVTMARASWTTGYFQAAVYQQLMSELGYNVTDPSALELDPNLAFLSMAQGEFDFWVNSWYPGHLSWHESELPDGSKVDDHVSVVGEQMTAGGLQGFLITKSVADDNGITTLDQINEDPALMELFDTDGDGAGEIYGCPDSWTCDNIITEMICQFGWNFTQNQAGYDAMIAEAVTKANAGEAMIIYTWTPSAYITQLIPGDNVMWVSVDGEVDDQNCSGQENAESYAQPNALAAIGEDSCLFNAAGECRLAWTAADIRVTGNSKFLEANPAAAELLAQVEMPLIDVALANVEQDSTDGSAEAIGAIAGNWIADNRELVDPWLEAARKAG